MKQMPGDLSISSAWHNTKFQHDVIGLTGLVCHSWPIADRFLLLQYRAVAFGSPLIIKIVSIITPL